MEIGEAHLPTNGSSLSSMQENKGSMVRKQVSIVEAESSDIEDGNDDEVDSDFITDLRGSPSGTVLDVCPVDELSERQVDENDVIFIPGLPIVAKITGVERMPRTHPFNPNLYTIELSHGEFKWTIRRRFKHFLRLNAGLFLHKVHTNVNVRRQSFRHHGGSVHGNMLPSRHLPKRPDALANTANLENRIRLLERYLQVILNNKNYRSHKETLAFLEVSHLSFMKDLGAKGREGILRKRAGGHRFPAGCCSCCSSMSWGIWDKRWLMVKDSFIAYVSPRDNQVRGVLLMDKEFTLDYGKKKTGVNHGLLIRNQARELLVSCWTSRKASEWMTSVLHVMAGPGAEWIKEQPHGSFASVRQETFVQWFVDGASYFDAVAKALEEAKDEIFIADWWLSPELQLCRPVTQGNKWRLDHVLKRKAENGVKVYVLLYKEVELALTINSAYTKATLQSLNPNIKVLRHPDHVPGSGVIYWAHHEKIVAIDQKVAFIGGLDLCFGRWDDCAHRLTDFGSAAPTFKPAQRLTRTELEIGQIGRLFVDGHVVDSVPRIHPEKNRKSGNVSRVKHALGTKLWVGKDYSNPIKRDFFDIPKPFEDSVDRGSVARMPWHDVGVCVYGASARDVSRHFILRWNAAKLEKVKAVHDVPYLLPKSYGSLVPHSPGGVKTSSCNVQILRSLSSWSAGVTTEASIHQAYLDTIHNASHFIYIENQFFISSVFSDGVRNEVAEALFLRISRAHSEGKVFRVIVVMPLLPAFEGELGTPTGTAIGAITHWNYRSICRGQQSLLSRLEAAVGDPSEYISFYGLRNYAEIYGKPITELVYVHTKLLIADDNTVIIGSANINDRSLLGFRDSEIAAIIRDTETVPSRMNGEDYQAGKFAHSLRTALFKEHLGEVGASDSLNVEDPTFEDFYKNVWMAIARRNTEIFEEVFHCIPSDQVRSFADLQKYKTLKGLGDESPCAARDLLNGVKGHLVELPLHFLENEDLKPAIGTSEYLVSSDVFT